jgi:hypothetical protein
VLSNAKVCVITVVCNLRRIVQINFLVKSEESRFIVATCRNKTRDTGVRSGIDFNKGSMDSQRIMEILLARMDANTKTMQEQAEANTRALRKTMMTNQDVLIKTVKEEMRAMVDACHKEMMAYLGKTEADTEKPDPIPGMMQSTENHQEIPKGEAAVIPVKGWKKQRRARKPAAGRRGEPNELTRSDCGSGKHLAAACRKVSRCATVAWRKRNVVRRIVIQENYGPRSTLTAAGIMTTRCAKVARGREHGLQRQGKDDIAPITHKQRKEEGKGLWKGPECNSGIRDRGLREQLQGTMGIRDLCGRGPLYLRNKGTTSGINKRAIVLEIAKRVVVTPSWFRKIRKWTLWRGRLPPKRKKSHVRGKSQANVGTPATPGVTAHTVCVCERERER